MQGKWSCQHQSHILSQINAGLQITCFLKTTAKNLEIHWLFVAGLPCQHVNTEMIYQIAQQTNCTLASTKIRIHRITAWNSSDEEVLNHVPFTGFVSICCLYEKEYYLGFKKNNLGVRFPSSVKTSELYRRKPFSLNTEIILRDKVQKWLKEPDNLNKNRS